MTRKLEQLKELLLRAQGSVFFGGAGVSTESGIPDFRGAEGLYLRGHSIPPETILSHSFFMSEPRLFYRYYRSNLLFPNVKPNLAHQTLAAWERRGLLQAVITQNIDGLHQMAGSKCVHELHGSVHRNRCMRCNLFYGLEKVMDDREDVPHCSCGGIIKPEVVLYEEPLPQETMRLALRSTAECDLMIVGGTSLRVYPAAGFAREFHGRLVIINKTATDLDGRADLLIQGTIGEVLHQVDALLGGKASEPNPS